MKKNKKTLGIILMIVGCVLFFFSMYIHTEVAEGQEQISSAKQKVGVVNKIFSITAPTDQVGQTLTSPINKKIAEGENEVTFYDSLAKLLKIGGIVSFFAGAALILFNRSSPNRG